MNISFLLDSRDWDFPFFKRLSPNDAGDTGGHQAGFLIPTSLRQWFPGLHGETNEQNPTISAEIVADLYDGREYLGQVTTNYRYQSWGGTRSYESRLTGGLAILWERANGGDFVVCQRRVDDISRYQLVLVKNDTADHAEIAELDSRWGALYQEREMRPLTNEMYRNAEREQITREEEAFQLFDRAALRTETRQKRIARSTVFSKGIRELYNGNCCVCSFVVMHPDGEKTEMEAAHVVPRKIQGADDSRNGLGLCRRHHWAFDQGLFGIDDNSEIVVPDCVREIPNNDVLLSPLIGQAIWQPPVTPVAPEALRWHREYVLLGDP